MKAAFLLAPRRIEIRNVDLPQPRAGEVSIRPILAGICGSDVSLFMGHRIPAAYPLLLGHELVGHITAVGEGVSTLAVGQRVTVEPNFTCGVCGFCRSGRGNICPNKKSLGVNIAGCFAESFVAPAEFVWPIPDTISNEDAATIEPLAVSLHAFWHSGARLGDTVAVLGCGATGLLMIQAAVASGIRVIAHSRSAGKLELARSFGAVIGWEEDVAKLWQRENVTTVFECAGVSSTVELALSATPRGGKVVLLGLSTSPASFVPLRLIREGISVSGSIIYDHPSDFGRAIALVANGTLRPSRIVASNLPFVEIESGLELANSSHAGKVLLEV
jgi:L-iditol 2-dehydrogenase